MKILTPANKAEKTVVSMTPAITLPNVAATNLDAQPPPENNSPADTPLLSPLETPPASPSPAPQPQGIPLMPPSPQPTTAKPKPLTIWRPSQFLAHKADRAENLLGDGFLRCGAWTSLVGIGGVGKSRLALWLAACQILGREWARLPTCGTPQVWLLLGNENGISRWKIDLTRLQRHMTAGDFAKLDEHLRIQAIDGDDDDDDGGALSILTPEAQSRLAATIREANPGVVVFDPLGDIVDGDENKTSDMIETLRTLRGIVRRNSKRAAVLVLHHSRTGAANVAQAGDAYNAGNFGRGSKALYSNVRCEIQIAPADRDDSDKIVVACGKANDTRKFSPRCVDFDDDSGAYNVDEDFDFEEWRKDVVGKPTEDGSLTVAAVVGIVKGLCPNIGNTVKSGVIIGMCEEQGASTRTAKRRLKQAVEKGDLRQVTRGEYALAGNPL